MIPQCFPPLLCLPLYRQSLNQHTQPLNVNIGCVKADTSNDIDQHIQIKHKLDESFSYPTSEEWIKCGDCADELSFCLDDHFAIHAYHEHKYITLFTTATSISWEKISFLYPYQAASSSL